MQPFHKVLARAIGTNIGSLLGYPNGDFGQVAREVIEGTDTYYEVNGKRLLLDDSKSWNAFHVLRDMVANNSATDFSCRGIDLDSQMSFVLFGYMDNIQQDNAWTCISAFDAEDVIYKGSDAENTFTGYASFTRVIDKPVDIARRYGLQVEKVTKRQTELVALEIQYVLSLKGAKKKGSPLSFTVSDGATLTPSFPSTCCPQNNLNASALPTATDDYSAGYRRGSEWIFNGEAYCCVDPTTGAAVWEHMTFSVDEASLLYAPLSHTHNNYLESIVAGTNVTIDNTNPQNPIINASGGGGGSPGGANEGVQYNDNGVFNSDDDFEFYKTKLWYGARLRLKEGDFEINDGHLVLNENPNFRQSQFGKAKFYYDSSPVNNIFVEFGDEKKSLAFQSPSFVELTGTTYTHGVNNLGVTYIVNNASGTTVTLSRFQGDDSLRITYFNIGAGNLTIAQSGGTLYGAKTVFPQGESVIVEYVPESLGTSIDNNWVVYSN